MRANAHPGSSGRKEQPAASQRGRQGARAQAQGQQAAGTTRGHQASAAMVQPREPAAAGGKAYVVKQGDTLWELAETFYGTGTLWPKLWHANKAVVPEPKEMQIGIRLVIPDLDGQAPASSGAERGGGTRGEREPPASRGRTPVAPAAPKGDGARGGRAEAGARGQGGGQAAGGRRAAGPVLTPEESVAARKYYDWHPGDYPAHVVRKIQAAIGVKPDGVIGPATLWAIAAWQQAHGLASDGIAGTTTLEAMFGRDIRHDPAPTHKPGPGGTMGAGAIKEALDYYQTHRSQYTGVVVKQIEVKLGMPADGEMDGVVVQSIAAWQRSHGLKADGLAGPATLTAMFGRDIRMGQDSISPTQKPDNQKPEVDGDLSRPNGLAQIRKVFGEPGTNIVSASMRAGAGGEMVTVRCHKKIAGILASVFDDIHADGMSQHIKSYDGGYVYRKKRSSGSAWSTHAWGIAVDINAAWNPMTSKGNPKISGDQSILAPYFEKHGFYWGAHFNDAMHFQYCTGY